MCRASSCAGILSTITFIVMLGALATPWRYESADMIDVDKMEAVLTGWRYSYVGCVGDACLDTDWVKYKWQKDCDMIGKLGSVDCGDFEHLYNGMLGLSIVSMLFITVASILNWADCCCSTRIPGHYTAKKSLAQRIFMGLGFLFVLIATIAFAAQYPKTLKDNLEGDGTFSLLTMELSSCQLGFDNSSPCDTFLGEANGPRHGGVATYYWGAAGWWLAVVSCVLTLCTIAANVRADRQAAAGGAQPLMATYVVQQPQPVYMQPQQQPQQYVQQSQPYGSQQPGKFA